MVADDRIKSIVNKIVESIKEEYKPEKIILYGSFAYGNPHRDSDIDLLIIKETQERLHERMFKIRDVVDIRDSSWPAFSPLILTLQEIKVRLDRGDQFIADILSKGEVLYDRK